MTWTSIRSEQLQLAQLVIKWIETVRAPNAYNNPTWLPTEADIHKSALLISPNRSEFSSADFAFEKSIIFANGDYKESF